jgi:hypothetical protein
LPFRNKGKLSCDVTFAPFARRHRNVRRGQDATERQLSASLHAALEVSIVLERFPKALLEAHIVILETGSGTHQHSKSLQLVVLYLPHATYSQQQTTHIRAHTHTRQM